MNESKELVSIIIAAYNEEKNIAGAIEAVHRVLPDAEVVVVDDGSQDNTVEVAKKYECDLVQVVPVKPNRGKGHAIRTGINAARGSIMAQLDADLQFPPEGFPKLFQPIYENQADIVFGTRYSGNPDIEKGSVSFIKRLASHVMGWFITCLTFQRHTDVFAGFKAWKADVIRDIDLQCDDFTYEAEITLKAKKLGYRLVEVPTDYKKRTEGHSNIKILYHTIVITLQILRIAFVDKPKRREPLKNTAS